MQLINKSIVKWRNKNLEDTLFDWQNVYPPRPTSCVTLLYLRGVQVEVFIKMYKLIWVFLNGYIFSTYTLYLGVNIIYCSILLSINIEIVWCKLSIPCCNHELNRKSTNKHGLQKQRKTTWGRHTTRRCLSGCCNCG